MAAEKILAVLRSKVTIKPCFDVAYLHLNFRHLTLSEIYPRQDFKLPRSLQQGQCLEYQLQTFYGFPDIAWTRF